MTALALLFFFFPICLDCITYIQVCFHTNIYTLVLFTGLEYISYWLSSGSGVGFWISNPIGQHYTQLNSPRPSEKQSCCNFQNFQVDGIEDPPIMTLPSHSGNLFFFFIHYIYSTFYFCKEFSKWYSYNIAFLLYFIF